MESIEGKQIKNYTILHLLGKGSFGKVYEGINQLTKQIVAIKIMSKKRLAKQHHNLIKYAQTEIQILKKCQGKQNIINFVQDLSNQDQFIIVTQYCNGGELADYIKKKNGIPEDQAIIFLKQILSGFKILHENNTMHRDFKCENVLLHNGICKIADLGLAKQFTNGIETTNSSVGTQVTMAPQVNKFLPYTFSADIWSIGIVFYAMIYGRYPLKNSSDWIKKQGNLENKYKEDQYVSLNLKGINISKQAQDFINRCVQVDPQKRIKWSQIYDHPLIAKKDEKKLSLIFGLIVKIVDVQNNKKFYEDKLKNIQEIKPIQEQNASYEQDYIQNIIEDIDPFILEYLIKENSARQQKEKIFIEHQQMYLNEVKNIFFFFKFIFPYVTGLKKFNRNHALSMLILMKEVYYQLDKFLMNFELDGKNFTNMPIEYYSQFNNSCFYSELKSQIYCQINQIYYQMECYRQDLEIQKELNTQIKQEVQYLTFLGTYYKKIKKQNIQRYWSILAEYLKEVDEDQKQDLIRVIKALQYLKILQKLKVINLTKQFQLQTLFKLRKRFKRIMNYQSIQPSNDYLYVCFVWVLFN